MNEIILSNGVKLPSVGLGANGIWGNTDTPSIRQMADEQYNIYSYALKSGKCCLFDTSESYGLNEKVLGRAISDAGARNKISIITKVGNESQRKGDIRGALEKSLHNLKTDYIDVYLMHWPQQGTFLKTYQAMEQLYDEGMVKAIGVCNCNIHHLEELQCHANVMPMLHEFEIHPLFTQDALIHYCYAFDIKVIAYTPVGRMHDVLIKAKPIRKLSEKYGKTPVQIILRWHYQLGRITIPRTMNTDHFDEIFSIDEFNLSEKEVAWISSLNDNIRLRYNPDTCDFGML